MVRHNYICRLALVILSVWFAWGCSKDDGPSAPALHAYFSNGTATFPAESDGKWLQIVTGDSWTLTITTPGGDTPAWCYVGGIDGPQTAEGTGNTNVWIAAEPNPTAETYGATITVTAAGGARVVIEATQLSESSGKKMELPRIVDKGWYVYHPTGNYSFEYMTDRKHAKWVAWPLYKGCMGNSGRSDDFRTDPAIPSKFQPYSTFGRGYDRGHMCPSADRTASHDMNSETFYYTNMSPQVSNLNQGIWAALETKERGWLINNNDTIFICCGGTVVADEDISGYTSNGSAIPRFYFKVLLRKRSTGAIDAAGFWFENRSYAEEYDPKTMNATQLNAVLAEMMKPIDWIEERTGFDFFYNLPENIQTRVEAECNPKAWSLVTK